MVEKPKQDTIVLVGKTAYIVDGIDQELAEATGRLLFAGPNEKDEIFTFTILEGTLLATCFEYKAMKTSKGIFTVDKVNNYAKTVTGRQMFTKTYTDLAKQAKTGKGDGDLEAGSKPIIAIASHFTKTFKQTDVVFSETAKSDLKTF